MTKISDLTALTGAGVDDAADLLPIVDMSEAGSARNKKITIDEVRIALGLSSADSPQFTAINLGHASDTTITRASAGVAAIEGVNIVTTAGGVTFAADIVVPAEAYGVGWNGSNEAPTKNDLYDKIETIAAGSGVDVEDEGTPEATGATTLNFVGAGVTAADMGAGVVDITIPGGGASALNDLSDVDTTGAASGNVLTYDGAQWEPVAPSTAALSAQYEDQKASGTAGGGAVSGAWYGRVLNTEVYDDIGLSLRSSTFTVTIATPALFTWTAHGLVAGSPVVFTTSGALPTGLTAGTTYWVIAAGLTANDFEVSATQGGAAVNTSGSQSGTHTATASVLSLAAGTYEVESETMLYDCAIARSRIRDITNGTTLGLSTNAQADAGSNVQAQSHIFTKFTLAGTALIQLEYRVGSSAATNGLGVVSSFGEVEVYSRIKLTKLS